MRLHITADPPNSLEKGKRDSSLKEEQGDLILRMFITNWYMRKELADLSIMSIT